MTSWACSVLAILSPFRGWQDAARFVTKLLPNLVPEIITKDQKKSLKVITKDFKKSLKLSGYQTIKPDIKPWYPNLYREYNRYMDIVLLVILGVLAIGFAYINWWIDQ
jgi:hypothetical protein